MDEQALTVPKGLVVGCSGYVYPEWRGRFYPEDLQKDAWLGYYAERFRGVEINNTFYALPERDAVRSWKDAAPPGFRFCLKLSRYGTHLKHLKDPGDWLPKFCDLAGALGAREGPILAQLPPHWNPDVGRLRDFVDAMPGGHRWAVEFRDESWFTDGVIGLLADAGVAVVRHDMLGDHPCFDTAEFAYMRYHGPNRDSPYTGSYSHQKLTAEAERIAGLLDAGRRVFAFFNNDAEGDAPFNAMQLIRYVASARES